MRSHFWTPARVIAYVLVCLLVVATAFGMGYVTHVMHSPAIGNSQPFAVFWEAWDLVDRNFYGTKPDETTRAHGAIKGSLSTLDDPYTVLVEPRERDREQEELRGSFGGIGVVVERTSDGRIIMTPVADRPAAKAGILAGDELIAVDGLLIGAETPFDDVLAAVRGKVGTSVKLTIRRQGVSQPLTIEVRREEIVTPSVTWELEAPDVGYVKLSIFNERTSDELKQAIQELRKQGATAFVIDLRNNGGGLLSAAIDVASQFLEDGVVMYERQSDGMEKAYPVKDDGILLEDPIAVLVNSGTASASEIVAGAIQDHQRGSLIGTKTFGKASVQLLFDLSDGSSLHVTNAHWLTPNRHEIHGIGLTPDLEVEITDQDRQEQRDTQREQAAAYLRQQSRAIPVSAKGNGP
jgi:carboxyl-terminal processing protease